MSKPKAIIVSGYFNPLHKGHLELFQKAKAAGGSADIVHFVRLEVGEGIEVAEEDFAAEVAAQMEAAKK